MNRPTAASRDRDILASLKALRRAAQRALELGLSTGTPVYVMKAGKIVDLTQDMAVNAGREVPMAVRESRASYGNPLGQSAKGTRSPRRKR